MAGQDRCSKVSCCGCARSRAPVSVAATFFPEERRSRGTKQADGARMQYCNLRYAFRSKVVIVIVYKLSGSNLL